MRTLTEKATFVKGVREIVTFRFLSDADILDILDHNDLIELEEGEVIVEEGEVSPYFYGIVDGTVAVSVGEEDAKVYVNSLGAGDVFGESGVFMSVPRTATVTAQSTAVIVRVHRNELASFLRRRPEPGNKILLVFIYSLLRKLKLADQELAYERKSDLAQDDVDALVANLFGEKA
jgi:CRP/FNR family transcriptional regulator, cyclic AMP receptor protein